MRFYQEYDPCILYDTTIPLLVSLFSFHKVESAGELELDLYRLVTFNATKAEWLSFNRHREPLLVPVEMNGIELREETSFCLHGLTFTPSMDWKPYIPSIAKKSGFTL